MSQQEYTDVIIERIIANSDESNIFEDNFRSFKPYVLATFNRRFWAEERSLDITHFLSTNVIKNVKLIFKYKMMEGIISDVLKIIRYCYTDSAPLLSAISRKLLTFPRL